MSDEKNNEQIIQDLIKRVETLEENAPEDKLAMGIMSGDLDYLIASFIVALGAAAYDMEVDMFFTFWATSALCSEQCFQQEQANYLYQKCT